MKGTWKRVAEADTIPYGAFFCYFDEVNADGEVPNMRVWQRVDARGWREGKGLYAVQQDTFAVMYVCGPKCEYTAILENV